MAVSAQNIQAVAACSVEKPGLMEKLNTSWHKPALLTFMAIVIGQLGRASFSGLSDLCPALAAAEGARNAWFGLPVDGKNGDLALWICPHHADRIMGAP
jgi:hypothetical protein